MATKQQNDHKGRLVVLVREIDLRWNTIEPSILLMYDKLLELGFMYVGGRVEVVDYGLVRNDD